MKPTVATKFLAFLLAACALVGVLACGGFALMLESYDLYTITPEEKQEQWYTEAGYPVAWRAASEAAAMGPGECSEALAEQLYGFPNSLKKEYYYVVVRQGNDIVHTISNPIEGGVTCEYSITPQYPKVVNIYPAYSPGTTTPDSTPTEGQPSASTTEPVWPELEPVRVEKLDVWEDLQRLIYELYYYDDGPTYTVTVTMAPAALKDTFHSNLSTLYPYRYTLVWGAVLALALMAVAVVYLVCVAGKTKDGSIHPGGLNRMPLDIYLLLAAGIAWLPASLAVNLYVSNNSLTFLTATLLALCVLVVCLLALAVIFALAAQVKMGGGYWWRHTVLGFCIRWLIRGIGALYAKLGIIWQWLGMMAVLLIVTILSVLNVRDVPSLLLCILCCALCLGVVSYGGWCFAMILSGARKMSQGEFGHKIPTAHLRGGFRDCAEQMNTLSETAMQAVRSQVRSERMKTELLTNVSHDIKTPLTSIINFVDLLGKAHTPAEQQQYLEVLSRQSLQLKKLIEDLIELSKASSGTMQANITVLDAAEAVNQALGEFSDKMAAAQLTPVLRVPEEPIMMAADGRLTWRVLSNLLNNAVKYATPGTRVYVELSQTRQQVLLSVKNVSREELRYTADELLERFVRGDASRNREGSGLGLNIAKSLMEVQHGSLQLLLDGDLFKVTLVFPKA